jgi:hypothetical protein
MNKVHLNFVKAFQAFQGVDEFYRIEYATFMNKVHLNFVKAFQAFQGVDDFYSIKYAFSGSYEARQELYDTYCFL